MTTNDDAQRGASSGLMELVGHALTDTDFRELLYRDREAVVREYHLTPADAEALDKLDRGILEEHVRQLTMGGATEVTISATVRTC